MPVRHYTSSLGQLKDQSGTFINGGSSDVILNPTLGNHIMNTVTYYNNAYDGYATPSIGVSGGVTRRALMKFTLPYATFVYTSFLSIKPQSSAASDTYSVYRIKLNITNAVTWSKYDGITAWTTAGGMGIYDIESTPLGTYTGETTGDTFFDIPLSTTEILKMMRGDYSNYGFLIKGAESSVVMTYYNYNHATVDNKPKLTLKYLS